MEVNELETINRVLVIYTGGTIGMVHEEEGNPFSPLKPGNLEDLLSETGSFASLGIELDSEVFDPPLDSSQMTPSHWLRIARVIRDRYNDFSGFVVLHGTDTMTYTTSALSFLLENLSKPVIVTGSQVPIARMRSDARQNLVTAVQLASPDACGVPCIPEVALYFGGCLYRGNRVTKEDSKGFEAFVSQNLSPLAKVGESIEVATELVRDPSSEGFFIYESFEPHIIPLKVYPGMDAGLLKSIFAISDLKGVVLEVFGSGTAPSSPSFLREIHRAVERGIAVVAVSQCPRSGVEIGLYEASSALLDQGVISGLDLTPEAALTKLGMLLGQGYSLETIAQLMQVNHRGEQSKSIYTVGYDNGEARQVFNGEARQLTGRLDRHEILTAHVRIQDIRLLEAESGEIDVQVFLNMPNVDDTTELKTAQHVKCAPHEWDGTPGLNIIADATATVRRVVDPLRPVRLSVRSTSGPVSFEKLVLSIVAKG